jgi:hypothetical protein
MPAKALKLLVDRQILANDFSTSYSDSIELVKHRLLLESQRARERQLSVGERREAYRNVFRRRKERNDLLERKAGVVKIREDVPKQQKEELDVVLRLKMRAPRRFKGSMLPTECAGLLTHTSVALNQRLFPSPTPQPSGHDSPDLFPIPETLRTLQLGKRDSRTVYSVTPVPSLTPEPQLHTRLSVNLGSSSPKSKAFVTSGGLNS